MPSPRHPGLLAWWTLTALVLVLPSCQLGLDEFDLATAELVGPTLPPAPGTQDPKRLAPDTTKSDWIRLKSDEWLKGELLSLRDGTLEFDSAELDELKLDWDDVAAIHTSKPQTILLEDRRTHTGRIRVEGNRLQFLGDQVRQVDRAQLLSIVPGAPSELHRWSGKLSAGLTLQGGNTQQADTSLYAFARRESAATRWDSKYHQQISEVGGSETANSLRVESEFHVFLTRRLYVTLLGGSYFRDRFQNIDYRISPRVGLGYDLASRPGLSWEILGGPAFQETRFVSVPPGQDPTEQSAAIVVGTLFGWDITPDIEFDFEYQLAAPIPDTQDYNHHLLGKLSIDLIGDLDLDISFVWDRNNERVTSAGGITPKADDYRLFVGFGFDF